MFISNVNWCYRVAFHEAVNDVERINLNAFVIKPANITVYRQQYDQPTIRGYFNILYLYLDLFISDTNTDDLDQRPGIANNNYKQNVRIVTAAHDEDNYNDKSEHNAPISVIIVTVLFSLILVIGLFRIRFANKTQTEHTDVQEGSDVIGIDESGMQEDGKQAEIMVYQATGKEPNNLVDNNSVKDVNQAHPKF